MERILHFRSTIDSFDENEFNLFCNKLYEQYNKRELIIDSLFYLFLEESKHNKHQNVIQINQITKDIMDLRNDSPSSGSVDIEPITITQLPSPLIAYISSYLRFFDQIQMMRCNRFISSSLYSASLLPTDVFKYGSYNKWAENYGKNYYTHQISKLNKFSNVKKIAVSPYCLNKIYNIVPWTQLHLDVLKLDGLYFSRFETDEEDKQKYLKIIHVLKQVKVKTLELDGNVDNIQEFIQFLHLIVTNKNIECLWLNNFHIQAQTIHIDVAKTHDLISSILKLKCLIMYLNGGSNESDDIEMFLPIITKECISLHLKFHRIAPQCVLDSKCCNLEELCIEGGVENGLISNIVQYAVKLQRFHWYIPQYCNLDLEGETAAILETVFMERESVNYLSIHSHSFDIFKMLMKILNKDILRRYDMKLRWYLEGEINEEELQFLKDEWMNFITHLECCVYNDFMFVFETDMDITQELFTLTDGSYLMNIAEKNVWSIVGSKVLKQVVICNEGNRMCGYRELWKYSCHRYCCDI